MLMKLTPRECNVLFEWPLTLSQCKSDNNKIMFFVHYLGTIAPVIFK